MGRYGERERDGRERERKCLWKAHFYLAVIKIQLSFIIFSVDFLFLLHHLEYAVMLYIKLTEKVAKNLELKLLCKIEKNVCAGAMMDDTKKNNEPKHQMQNCLKTINHMPKCWQMKLSSYQSATHSKWNVDKQKKIH